MMQMYSNIRTEIYNHLTKGVTVEQLQKEMGLPYDTIGTFFHKPELEGERNIEKRLEYILRIEGELFVAIRNYSLNPSPIIERKINRLQLIYSKFQVHGK